MAVEISVEQLVGMGLEESLAREMVRRVNQLLASFPASVCWQKISKEVLAPDHPFALHTLLHSAAFDAWDSSQGPVPAWIPSGDFIKTTNIAGLMENLKLGSYDELHRWSVQDHAGFWDLMIQRLNIRFKHEFTQVMDLSTGVESPRWLPGAKLNIADSCFNTPGNSVAIIYQQEGIGLSTMTCEELSRMVNRVSNALMDEGFKPGDAIAIDMPMTAESVAIYLGIIKAGCRVISIADSFAPDEIGKRLRLGNAKLIFTQDYIMRSGKSLPLYSKVLEAGAPKAIVLAGGGRVGGSAGPARLRDGDFAWEEFLSDKDHFDSAGCDPGSYTNVLFSSGTTGDPKVVPWTHVTPVKCAADGHLHQNIQSGDIVAWPTNLGWMMGPWLIYASLINRATIALYYGAPTGRGFCRFVQDAGVTMLGVVPGLVATWRNTGCIDGFDWSSIKAFSSTGECSNPEDMHFLMSMAGYKPVIEYCGGTEIGGAYITGTMVQPAAPATFSTPALGSDFLILDENGLETDNGELFLIPPSIGLSTTLIGDDHHRVYFDGTPSPPPEKAFIADEQGKSHTVPLRRHGDQVERLGKGYFRMHGRVDDTMNISGIKVSSAEIERTLNSVSGIHETAAIAVPVTGGGMNHLVIYAVLLEGVPADIEKLKPIMQLAINQHNNPLFKIHDVRIVDSLPRTASNKVMRRKLRAAYKSSGPGTG
jgi:acetyl-CoA synthetase